MSYIINNTSSFVNIKLTDTGRRKLAQGQLNFSGWAIGDSEINYDREYIVDNYQTDPELSASTMVLRPFDLQPNLKHFITTNGSTAINPFSSGEINTIKAIVNNKATERGFFTADSTHSTFTTLTASTYAKATGFLSGTSITGGTTLKIGTGYTYSVGDYILIKLSNDTVGSLSANTNSKPVPHLWYKIQSTGTTTYVGDTITVDRALPNRNTLTATTQFIIYPGGELTSYYGLTNTTAYWNTNTLNFDNCCDISCGDVPVWNMNNVWCENLAGMTGSGVNSIVSTPNESYEKFGSYEYLGFKYPYMESKCVGDSAAAAAEICGTPGQSTIDDVLKSISIIHYTNNTISNYYGEFLFIDNSKSKTVTLYMPDLMWYRRDFATASGTSMGMNFIASGATKVVGSSQIEYIDLIEDPTLIPVDATPMVVGRVLPQLKMVVLMDDELVAAISYKSNRNWTLPPLIANLKSPAGGSTSGLLQPLETIWMTYTFENSTTSGLTTTLPCQKYIKLYNNTSSSKDVEFRISDTDLLPYMRKEEATGYDGMGFSARQFKLVYQVLSTSDRPSPDAWKVHDFTSTAITSVLDKTIDPKLLETQNPSAVGFNLVYSAYTGDSTFSIINSLSMTPNSNTSKLQFGDERFFYGNIDTYIGANIYKTTFNLNVSANKFKYSSNPTRSSDTTAVVPDIKITEIGVYDTAGDLVMIGKLSKPVRLYNGNTVMLELSMDF